MEDKLLICTMGLPRSGKSTWAREYSEEGCYPIVNPDSIRLAVHGQAYIPQAEPMIWTMAGYMVRSLFIAGHKAVILDATNTTRWQRDQWQSEDWDTVFHHVETDVETCKDRAVETGFPIEVIDKMAEDFEPLQWDELAYAYGWKDKRDRIKAGVIHQMED